MGDAKIGPPYLPNPLNYKHQNWRVWLRPPPLSARQIWLESFHSLHWGPFYKTTKYVKYNNFVTFRTFPFPFLSFPFFIIVIAYSNKKLSYRRETARQLCTSTLANWSCNAHNTAESQRFYYFWHSNALIEEVLAENAFCHEIAAQGHSRPFTLQSFAGRQGVAYRHILLLAVSQKFSKTYPPKSPKIAVVDNLQCRLTPLLKGIPANICMNLIFSETRFIGLHFCRWQYGSIFIQICAVGSKGRIYAATECWPKTDFDVK